MLTEFTRETSALAYGSLQILRYTNKQKRGIDLIYLGINMEQVFVVATIITVLFCLSKFIELRYLSDERKPLKDVVRDSIVVMVCAITGSYFYFQFSGYIADFFNIVTETRVLNPATTQVFTDVPNF